jgi:hypothetical protein
VATGHVNDMIMQSDPCEVTATRQSSRKCFKFISFVIALWRIFWQECWSNAERGSWKFYEVTCLQSANHNFFNQTKIQDIRVPKFHTYFNHLILELQYFRKKVGFFPTCRVPAYWKIGQKCSWIWPILPFPMIFFHIPLQKKHSLFSPIGIIYYNHCSLVKWLLSLSTCSSQHLKTSANILNYFQLYKTGNPEFQIPDWRKESIGMIR